MVYSSNYLPAWEEEYQEKSNPELNEELRIDKELEKPIISTGRIGMTISDSRQFGDFRKTMLSAARKGTTKVEFATVDEMGRGAESYGKTKRQELKELSFATGVEINSVHAPTWIEGLSGIDLQHGKLSEDKIKRILNTTEHVMEFAADIQPKKIETKTPTDGISVVVHIGEYPFSAKPKELEPIYREEEERYGKFVVSEDNPYFLIDTQNNQILGAITKQFRLVLPKVELEKTKEKVEIKQPWENGTNIEVLSYDFDEIRRVTEKLKEIGFDYNKVIENIKDEKERNLAIHLLKTAEEYKEITNSDPNYLLEKPHLAAYILNTDSERRENEAWMMHYEKDFEELIKQYKAIKHFRERIKEDMNSEYMIEFAKKHPYLWKIFNQKFKVVNVADYPIHYDVKTIIQTFDETLEKLKKEIKNRYNGIVSHREKIAQIYEMEKRVKPLEDVAIEKSVNTLAELGLRAYEITKKKNLNKPLYLAPENWVPEAGFGTHPEELLFLIRKAREKMTERLVKEYHMSKKEAEKLAKQHIKITLDTEHLGLWQNYFNPKPGEDKKEAFMRWFKDKIKKLIDEDVIGNVHLVGSLGAHKHLPPGEGELPLKEVVQELIKSGYQGPMNSEGFGDPEEQLFAAWRNLTNAIYVSSQGKGVSWEDVSWENTYTKYRVGEYGHTLSLIPDESWKFWSNLPID